VHGQCLRFGPGRDGSALRRPRAQMSPMLGLCAILIVSLATLSPLTASAGESGESLYLLHCSGCHGPDGMGERRADVPPLPPLVGNLLRDSQGRLYLVNVGGVITSNLNYADTAAVLNWLLQAFGASTLPPNSRDFDAAEVATLRAQRRADSVGLRRGIATRLKAKGIKLAAYPWP
jgi:mono/diheme cytochrome c family protein